MSKKNEIRRQYRIDSVKARAYFFVISAMRDEICFVIRDARFFHHHQKRNNRQNRHIDANERFGSPKDHE